MSSCIKCVLVCTFLYIILLRDRQQLFIERGLNSQNGFLKIFQVQEVSKKVVSEEKISIAVSKRKAAPPKKGTTRALD